MKFFFDPPHSGGGVPRGIGGGSQFQKSGKFHELPRKLIHCCLPPPTPTQLVGGGGRSQNWRDGWEGGTDGREGGRDVMAIMKNFDSVHMAWNGCIILIGNPSEVG